MPSKSLRPISRPKATGHPSDAGKFSEAGLVRQLRQTPAIFSDIAVICDYRLIRESTAPSAKRSRGMTDDRVTFYPG